MVIPYKLFLFLSNILLLSSSLAIHTQQPWQPCRMVNFSSFTVSTSSRGDPITHHMIDCHNIYLLIRGIFHQFFLYSYSKPNIILIYQGAAIWFYCVVLYMLLNCFFFLTAYITENTPKSKGNHACYATVSSASAGISQRVQQHW